MRVFRSRLYRAWYETLTIREKRVVDSRVDIFRNYGILRSYKTLDKRYFLYEFKWPNGFRVYFSLLKDREGNFMILLIGGNKNSQTSDIKESKRLVLRVLTSIKEKEKKHDE